MNISGPEFTASSETSVISYRAAMWRRSLAGVIGPDTNNETHFCLFLRACVNVEIWKAALHLLVGRHDSLRTICRGTALGPELTVLQEASILPLEFVDLTQHSGRNLLEVARAIASAFAWKPFELENNLLWRTQLIKVGDLGFVATLVVHHVVSDAVSILLLRHGLLSNYERLLTDRMRVAPKRHIGYIDYLHSMNAWLAGPLGGLSRRYWASRAVETPLPNYTSTYINAHFVPRQTFKISKGAMQSIRRHAQLVGSTPLYILLAIQAIALHRHSGETRVTLANVYANRDSMAVAFTSGYLADRLFVTVDVDRTSTIASVAEAVASDVKKSYCFRHYPYELIREAVCALGVRLFVPVFNYLPRTASALIPQSQIDPSFMELLPPDRFTAPPREMPYRMAITEYEDHAWMDYRTCYEGLQSLPQFFLAEVETLANCMKEN